MPKFVAMAIAAAFVGVALVGPTQTASASESMILAQSQVPAECAKIKDPAKRQECLQEKGGTSK